MIKPSWKIRLLTRVFSILSLFLAGCITYELEETKSPHHAPLNEVPESFPGSEPTRDFRRTNKPPEKKWVPKVILPESN